MSTPVKAPLVFLLDVDNTLLDNDRLKSDLAVCIERSIGAGRASRFWELYEQVRAERGYVDFPRTVDLLAAECRDERLKTKLTTLLTTFPFKDYLYAQVPETLTYLKTLGTVVILSDGDSVFQPLKIRESGLEADVDGRVLVYVHKEHELAKVFSSYPARHYVAVDDKPRIVAALERDCPETFTTVLVLQGKYAQAEDVSPKPDYVVAEIGALRSFTREQFLHPARASAAGS